MMVETWVVKMVLVVKTLGVLAGVVTPEVADEEPTGVVLGVVTALEPGAVEVPLLEV
jgi:hypothetical protein